MAFKVLSCDGGGVRGIVAAQLLERLATRLRQDLARVADLLAGSSAGAVLVCGLALGVSPADMRDLLQRRGREVFPSGVRKWGSRLGRVLSQGVSAPLYDARGLERVLREVFGDARFGDLPLPVLCTAYDLASRGAVVFKSWRDKHAELPVWQVCRASASAPVYFGAMVIDGQALVDGGVVANDPALCGVAEAIELGRSLSDLALVSVGTGDSHRPIDPVRAQRMGALDWAPELVGVLLDGPSDAVHYQAGHLIPDGYARLDLRLRHGSEALDNADPENLRLLLMDARNYLDSAAGGQSVDRAVELLQR